MRGAVSPIPILNSRWSEKMSNLVLRRFLKIGNHESRFLLKRGIMNRNKTIPFLFILAPIPVPIPEKWPKNGQ